MIRLAVALFLPSAVCLWGCTTSTLGAADASEDTRRQDGVPNKGDASSCPAFQSQPTCPVAPGAMDCARPSIGCGLDALPTGLSCSGSAQCSALIYPCRDWQKYIGAERTDLYVCSCVGGRWSCDDCWEGAAICQEAPDGASVLPTPLVDAASDVTTAEHPEGGADSADACAPTGCTATCLDGRHNVSSIVDGCEVWQCCVLGDAG